MQVRPSSDTVGIGFFQELVSCMCSRLWMASKSLHRQSSLCTGGEAAAPQQQYGPTRHTTVDMTTETDSDIECLEPDNTGDEEESGLPTCPICEDPT